MTEPLPIHPVSGWTTGVASEVVVALQLEFYPDAPAVEAGKAVQSPLLALTPEQAVELAKSLFLTASRILTPPADTAAN